MPATEQTWRDTKLLHVVFGVSGVLMLIVTVWMLAADHQREWKQYQRKTRDVESFTTQSRLSQQQNDDYRRKFVELEKNLDKAQHEVPSLAELQRFEAELKANAKQRGADPPAFDAQARHQAFEGASAEDVPAQRAALIKELTGFITAGRFREERAAAAKKFGAAYLDVARSQYELGVGNDLPSEKLQELQHNVDEIKKELDGTIVQLQEAKTHRKALEDILMRITKDEIAARKELEDHKLLVTRLETALYERQNSFSKALLEMPIIDAFGRPLKVEQIWLPKLTINNNFRDVARFDRCVTCHQLVDRTVPGSTVEPGYRPLKTEEVRLETPAEQPAGLDAESIDDYGAKLREIYGLQLADRGLLNEDDVTIGVVEPESRAAKAGLLVGDVVENIADVRVLDAAQVHQYLIDNVKWGQPIVVRVRRGLPNPYISHPRLDLYVGSMSPHKMGDIGCTICHEGQGSATSFKWASHSPTTPREGQDWKRDHGWFNNHHWIFPMNPKRFAESSCLKCHHDVTELEPSKKFPEPSAKKLLAGYHLISQHGCFGCHEINGFDGPHRRIGPDLRAEPNYSAAAQALLSLNALSDDQKDLANRVTRDPEDSAARRQLLQSIRVAAVDATSAGAKPAEGVAEAPTHKLPDAAQKLATLLEDVETPGKLRKVGPSLRHVADKLDFDFIYSWVRRPQDFRPDTRMPQFFGLFDALDGKGLAESQRFEPIEIRGIAEYLLAKSQPFAFAQSPRGVAPSGDDSAKERGKKLFEMRGCLACHKHKDFPAGTAQQGPNLSRMGDKLAREQNKHGRQWLYSWLRDPSRYHPRTLMPNMILEPITVAGRTTDPAADIAEYLLSSIDGPGANEAWRQVPQRSLTDKERTDLEALAFLHLKDKTSLAEAKAYIQNGIPDDRRSEIKGDEVELLGKTTSDEERDRKLLQYVGRRTITKFGCAGCHDVPGFEEAKPIGTGLADWGRKGTDKLAFEQIVQYLLSKEHGSAHGAHGETPKDDAGAHGHGFNFVEMDPDRGFYMQSLVGHERPGFIWQKLREPRSYDYKKTENKGYNERLRMPKFTAFSDTDREAVITFVLGLVAEPPAPQYVYAPDPARRAIRDGLNVLDKYNCKGCHTLQMDRWELAYHPDDFGDPSHVNDYKFLEPNFTPEQIKASLQTDARGLRHATIAGMPLVSEQTGKPVRLDEDRTPIEPGDKESKAFYSFVPWEHVLLNGKAWHAGLQTLFVPESAIVESKKHSAVGGDLARLIYPAVVADEKRVNPNAKAEEAWGWLPPPLVGEGRKVRSDWLQSFLLDPYTIRPATVLRMPKFNMSPGEAAKLVNYFAAVDGIDAPFDFSPRTREGYLAQKEAQHPNRMRDAMRIVTDNNYCIKCHLVGDFNPSGSERAKAPPLDEVYKRMRPEYVRDWIANPKRILPYTGMPQNIPPDKPISEQLFPGTSREQLEGLVDLLSNYDRFIESQFQVKRMIKPVAPAPPAAGDGSASRPRDIE